MAADVRDDAGGRHAWIEIDLGAIVENVECIAEFAGPGVALAPVVKADGYGHGLVEVARALNGHVEALCVATASEGSRLREAGIDCRIMLLYPVPASAIGAAIDADLEPTLMSADDADVLLGALAGRDAERSKVRVQLAIETGFGRGGHHPNEIVDLARLVASHPDVEIAGVWSHIATPTDERSAGAQLQAFRSVVDELRDAGLEPTAHIASSSAILLRLAPDLPLARPGLAVYGAIDPDLRLEGEVAVIAARLRPAMTLKARPIALTDVPTGETVGYGDTWRAARPSRIATLPVGYADGLARATQPHGQALVRGRRVPLVGVVSMDSVGVDITDIPDVGLDEEFVLLGAQGGERITATDLARQRNTIAWEVLTGMAARLARVYHRRTEPAPLRSEP